MGRVYPHSTRAHSNVRDRWRWYHYLHSVRYGTFPGPPIDPAPSGGFGQLSTLQPAGQPPPPPLSGVDLKGVPARQLPTSGTLDVSCTAGRTHVLTGPRAGTITLNTDSRGLEYAIEEAQYIWLEKNWQASAALLVSTDWSVEGSTVNIGVSGSFSSLDSPLKFNGNSVNNKGHVLWNGSSMPTNNGMIRDVLISSIGGDPTVNTFWSNAAQIGSMEINHSNHNIGNGRATNIRFQGCHIHNSLNTTTPIRQLKDTTDPTTHLGWFKIYDCSFSGNVNGGYNGTGMKWGTRLAGKSAPDYRNNWFNRCEEHCVYYDSPQGFAYFVQNENDLGGNTRTFIQMVNRNKHPSYPYSPDNPGYAPGGSGPVYYIQNVARDTGSIVAQGGSDYTLVGHNGIIRMYDNSSIGNWGPRNSSSARGGLTCWADMTVDPPPMNGNGSPVYHGIFEVTGPDSLIYATSGLEISGHYIGANATPADNKINATICTIDGVFDIYLDAFNFNDVSSANASVAHFGFNKYSSHGGNSFQYTNASAGPQDGIYGGVRWGPDVTGLPNAVWDYTGFSANVTKKVSHGYVAFANDRTNAGYAREEYLTEAQLNVYDGSDPV